MRLIADALSCQRSGRTVFEGLSFRVEPGASLLLTGRNGAGKSSLLLILAGLLEPAGGALRAEEGDPERSLAEQAHYVGHRDALKPSLTPLEALDFWQAMLGPGRTQPEAALERMGLGHALDLPCGYLSAGQRKRLALARLLVSHRPLWLLDEPTAALDTASQALFEGLVAEHLAAGGLAVAATHFPLAFPAATTLRIGSEA
ncbi:MAG: heme ABC exporter ATP-binding protein CcmA [Alsobacter sp.]